MGEMITLTVGMFILLVISYVFSEYDFFSPSFIICFMFTLGSILATYATASWGISESIFSSTATWIMLSGSLVFIIFEQITRRLILTKGKIKRLSSSYIEAKAIHISKLKFICLIIICVAGTLLFVYGIYGKVRANGYSGGFDFQAISSYNHRLSFQDETEGGVSKFIIILQGVARIAMYMCMYIFFNNVICCKEKIRRNLVYFIPVITWLPNVLITSSRGSYLQIAGAMVLIFYIAMCRRQHWRKMKKTHHKIIKYAVVSFVAVLLIFYAAVVNGAVGRQTNKTLIDYITMYLGAPIIHFHQFITSPPSDTIYFGQETFNKLLPVFQRFGLVEGTVSGQMEVRRIVGIYSGNVYTFFRRPYHDFGLLGMYVIVALTAIIFSYVYYKKVYGRFQSYKNDRTLILYSYFSYIIYIYSIDNAIYLYVYFGIIYFLVSAYVLYWFIFGKESLNCI